MVSSKEREQGRIRAFNEKQLNKMTAKVHAAMLVTKGTAGAPEKGDIRREIAQLIEWSKEPKEKEQVYFWGTGGFIMFVNRRASPWPTYTFFVPATSDLYVRPEED